MPKIKSNNVPSLTIERIIDSLTSAYVKIINAKMPIKTFPSVMLWGCAWCW